MIVKILLIDNNKNLGVSAREILKSSGYYVAEATDSEHAVSLLTSEKFDLVLIDIAFPGENRTEIIDHINKDQIHCKVIVITGTTGLQTEVKNLVNELKEETVRPYNPTYLVQSIEHVLAAKSLPHLKLQIIKAGEFLKSAPTGDLDLQKSIQILAQIASAGDHVQNYSVMIDLRDVESHLSTNDIYNLSNELIKYGETFHRKTAVLTQSIKGQDQAIFFETAAQNRGFSVKAFTSFEEAINWLSSVTDLPMETI